MKESLVELVKSPWGLPLLFGSLLLVGGAAGSLTIKGFIFSPSDRIALYTGAGLCFFAAVGSYFWAQYTAGKALQRLNVAEYGIKILDPKPDVSVGSTVRVYGKLKKPIPHGFRLQLLRRWETKPGVFYPVQIPAMEPDGEHWLAPDCYIGGFSGEGRIIEAVIVGPDGMLLFDTWSEGAEAFYQARRSKDLLFPGVKKFPADVVSCDRIRVKRS